MEKYFKFTVTLAFCLVLIIIFNANKSYASSDVYSKDLPKLKLSEVIKNNVKEAIITEIDVQGFPQINNSDDNMVNENMVLFRAVKKKKPKKSSKGRWIYMYTAQPYAFYRNSKTGQIKVIQVTSIPQHVINVVTKGWADSIVNGGNYLGGRP